MSYVVDRYKDITLDQTTVKVFGQGNVGNTDRPF